VHVASAGGVWMAAVYGFAGYRWRGHIPEFSPVLARRGRRLCVPLLLRGSLLEVDIEEHQVTYRVRSGDQVTASHYGQEFTVSAESPVSFPGHYRGGDGLAPGQLTPAGADPRDDHDDSMA
jgi:alpha,alpha-trehalose phosphorylase